jgi:glycosyltransferase involved in cell wall biosynthesis
VVVIPSRSDPLPTVALEAMAAGRTVVGTRVGGLPFLLAEGEAGVLVSPDSVEELAQALRRLAAEPTELQRLGAEAQARQAGEFSWASCA